MHANTDSPSMTKNNNTEDIIRYLYQHTIYDALCKMNHMTITQYIVMKLITLDTAYMKTCPKQCNYSMTLKLHKVKHT